MTTVDGQFAADERRRRLVQLVVGCRNADPAMLRLWVRDDWVRLAARVGVPEPDDAMVASVVRVVESVRAEVAESGGPFGGVA